MNLSNFDTTPFGFDDEMKILSGRIGMDDVLVKLLGVRSVNDSGRERDGVWHGEFILPYAGLLEELIGEER